MTYFHSSSPEKKPQTFLFFTFPSIITCITFCTVLQPSGDICRTNRKGEKLFSEQKLVGYFGPILKEVMRSDLLTWEAASHHRLQVWSAHRVMHAGPVKGNKSPTILIIDSSFYRGKSQTFAGFWLHKRDDFLFPLLFLIVDYVME